MAPKKAESILEQTADIIENTDLDQAIDDLRSTIRKDVDGKAETTGKLEEQEELSNASSFNGDGSHPGASVDAGDSSGSTSPPKEPAGNAPLGSGMTAHMDLIMGIPIDVQIVLGTSRMQVSTLMGLTEGATIALDRRIGEPVEIMVNRRVIGRGEITVLEGDVTRFGVKLIEIKGNNEA